MRRNITLLIIVVAAAIVVIIVVMFFGAQNSILKSLFYNNQLSAKGSSLLRLIQTIPIPNVNGRAEPAVKLY